jgi:hypothetical protein
MMKIQVISPLRFEKKSTLLRWAWLSLPWVAALCLMVVGPAVYAQQDTQHSTLRDSDGDTYPNSTERREGTDPLDAEDYPGRSPKASEAEQKSAGFPADGCRLGFRQAGSRLCINTFVQGATSYNNAAVFCRDQKAHVCTYEDFRYLFVRTTLDALYNPLGRWIGNMVHDDLVFCGNAPITVNNDPDIGNFEGQCNKSDIRQYWCCHDDDNNDL